MKIRNGLHALYKGKEYIVNREMNGDYCLMSEDETDLNDGFIELKTSKGFFTKILSRTEIGDVYDIQSYAVYKGHTFTVYERGDKLELLCSDKQQEFAIKELGFHIIEKGVYGKYVNPDELDEVFEEKRVIKGWK